MLGPWSKDYLASPDIDSPIGALDFILPPPIIYRYLCFNRAKQAIEAKKLWFSSPDSFNDPFDMHPALLDFTINRERAKEFAERNKAGQPRQVRRTLMKDALRRQDELKKHQYKLFAETRQNSGVCCFSERGDSSLMWSHYADSHSGVVLGFNIEPVFNVLGHLMMVQPVRYSHQIIARNYYDYKEEALMHWVLSKSAIWTYEQEVRAFSLKRNGLMEFDTRCLREVIFGCKTSDDHMQEITALVKDGQFQDVAFSRMIIDSKTFDIKQVPHRV